MAHPKRKTSKTRRDKRRTHYKAKAKKFVICPTTGESHLPHRACLLYTSPSPRDKTVSRMPSSA